MADTKKTYDKIPTDTIFELRKELGVKLEQDEYAILTFCIKYNNYSEAQGRSYFRLNQSFVSRQTGWERTKIVRNIGALIEKGFIKDVTPENNKGTVRIYALNDKLRI